MQRSNNVASKVAIATTTPFIELSPFLDETAIPNNGSDTRKSNTMTYQAYWTDWIYDIKPDSIYLRSIVVVLVILNLIVAAAIFIMVEYVGENLMYGDSLVVGLTNHHDLIHYMQAKANTGSISVDAGAPGHTISQLNDLWVQDVQPFSRGLALKSTIIFWDSDVSNIDETGLKNSQVNTLRSNYQTSIKTLVSKVKALGSNVAIAGPGVLGVNGIYIGVNKTSMLDAYAALNLKVAKSLKVPYIDIRTPLLKAIASGQDPTEDGEHLNSLGIQICGDLFIAQLKRWDQDWFSKYNY